MRPPGARITQRPPGDIDVLAYQATPGVVTVTPLSERAQDDLPAGTLTVRQFRKLHGVLAARFWKVRIVW